MKNMNLQYNFTDFKKAVKLLNKANIKVVVHIIDGLPFESKEDQLNTIRKINKLKIFGLKIHVLNVIENTKIAKMYLNNEFSPITEETFIDIACNQLALLNENVVIHRIGADSASNDLLAPQWVKKKMSIMDKIDNYMKENELFQGEKQ